MDQEIRPLGLGLGGRKQGRLLVVEDDAIFRLLLREVLHGQPDDLRFARSLAEAAEQMAHWRPNLVLTDLHLPDGQGADAVKRLFASGAPSVLAMTGDPDGPDAKAALGAGAAVCFAKENVEVQFAAWLDT